MTAFDEDESLRLIGLIRDRQEDQTANQSSIALADQLEAATTEIRRVNSIIVAWAKQLVPLKNQLDALTSALHAEFETSDPAVIVATTNMVIANRDRMQTERDVWRARAQIAELELEAMRPVVAATIADQDADCTCDNDEAVHATPDCQAVLAQAAFFDALATYRATADTRDAAISKIASEAPTT